MPLTRRECLLAAAAAPWRTKAAKNLKLGVFTSVYARLKLEEAAARIHADGFTCVMQQFAFADVRFNPQAPDWGAARALTQAFTSRGIAIAGLAGYYNIVDPDETRRRRGEERMRALITNWEKLGSPLVCTETGTRNAKSEWLEAPENLSEDAYQQCRTVLGDLAKLARSAGAVVAIEPYWRNVIGSAARAERLFGEVNSPALKLVMDPANYYRAEDLPRMAPVLEDVFRRVGRQTVVAHAKDVKAGANGTELPAAGLGVLDYPLYLELLARLDREMPLIVEHLQMDDVPRARDYVRAQLEKV